MSISKAAPPPSSELHAAFFTRPVTTVARALIGATLTVDGVGGIIVETEAYDRNDPASHSFAGPTLRNSAMFGQPGHAYVYRSYGIHWCLNFVCGYPGETGSAVLIRALEPVFEVDRMRARRGIDRTTLLCSGPGRLSQALDIDGRLNEKPLDRAPFGMQAGPEVAVAEGRRIGISRGVETQWRFALRDSPFLSRRM